MAEFTDGQLVEIVRRALAEPDMIAVDAALRVLAVQNPRKAQELIDIMQLGLDIRKRA